MPELQKSPHPGPDGRNLSLFILQLNRFPYLCPQHCAQWLPVSRVRWQATRIRSLIILSLAARLANTQGCDQTVQGPVSLPVKNVTLAGNHVRRGLEIHLGSPPQPLAVAVSG